MTRSINAFLEISRARRETQLTYNKEHNITPQSVKREIEERLSGNTEEVTSKAASVINDAGGNFDVTETIRELESEMLEASNKLEFEKAALLRDQINELKSGADPSARKAKPVSYKKKKKRRSAR